MSPQRTALSAPRRLPAELPGRLRCRRAEIEEALLARMRSVADPSEVGDADYVHGLRQAARAALECAIDALDSSHEDEQPLPPQLTAQARLAARRGVGLDTVIRRYVAGHTLLCRFLLREAGEMSAESLEDSLRTEAALLDRVIAEVSSAHVAELEHGHSRAERRRAEQVRRLLAGDPEDGTELSYDFSLWHLGVVVAGHGAEPLLRELATALDRRLLLVPSGREEAWAWFGGHCRPTATELLERVEAASPTEFALAIGEPGRGVSAWRLTHSQAKLALPIARRGPSPVVAYSDVALLASALGDEVLANSLAQLYLAPLEAERDGGAVLRETLHAYFAAEGNAASAAAALGVSRQTVSSRLHAAEKQIGQPLSACGAEVQTALRLRDLQLL